MDVAFSVNVFNRFAQIARELNAFSSNSSLHVSLHSGIVFFRVPETLSKVKMNATLLS